VAVGACTLLAASLHPAGRNLLRSVRLSRASPVMLALVVAAAVPLFALALSNVILQRMTVPDDHATLGHYGFVAAFSLTVIGAGLLASLRPDGWRLTAWVAGVLAALFGLTSLVVPDVASSLDPVWAAAAIAWGVVFIGAAELTRARVVDQSAEIEIREAVLPASGRGSIAGMSPWALLSGILVIVLVLLFAFMHLTGGGPGLHTHGMPALLLG
jgi:hypothetical protein